MCACALLLTRLCAATCWPRTKASEPGVALSSSIGPKSGTFPEHPFPQLSQRGAPGLDTKLQSLQGLAPNSRVPHHAHREYLRDASYKRLHPTFQQGVAPPRRPPAASAQADRVQRARAGSPTVTSPRSPPATPAGTCSGVGGGWCNGACLDPAPTSPRLNPASVRNLVAGPAVGAAASPRRAEHAAETSVRVASNASRRRAFPCGKTPVAAPHPP